MSVTLSDLQVLQNQIDSLTQAMAATISGRELYASVEYLEKEVNRVSSKMNVLDPRLVRLQQQLNSITLRFKTFASNEVEINNAAAVLPSVDQHAAFAGTSGEPSETNKFVTEEDGRLWDSRTPVAHKSSHYVGGSDVLQHALLQGVGTKSHPQIEADLVEIEAAIQSNATAIQVEADRVSNVEDYLADITADQINVGTIHEIPTKDVLSRVLTVEQHDFLTTSNLLTEEVGDTRYLPAGTFIPQIPPSSEWPDFNSFTVKDGIVSEHIYPHTHLQVDLGSYERAFGRIFADQFIDVSGNSVVIKDKHLGYNGTSELRFGEDKIILEPEFQQEVYVIRSALNSLSLSSKGQTQELKNIEARKVDKATLEASARLRSGVFEGFLKEVTWLDIKNKPTALERMVDMTKYRGVVTSYAELPLGGVNVGDFFIVLRAENPNLVGLYAVINAQATTLGEMYRSSFSLAGLSHRRLLNNEDDNAHPQYVLSKAFTEHLFAHADDVRRLVGVGTIGRLFTNGDRHDLDAAYNHMQLTTNPHKVTAQQIGAITDLQGSVKPYHLESVPATKVVEDSNHKFFSVDLEGKLTTAFSHVTNPLCHISDDERKELLGQGPTEKHYHASDRALENATGILSALQVNQEQLQGLISANVDVATSKGLSHPEKHTLRSHTDVNFDPSQVEGLIALHSKAGDAHGASFVSYGGIYGTATTVARSNHTHDDKYQSCLTIPTAMKPEDLVGTFRTDGEYLYLKINRTTWKKVKLEDL